MLSKLGVYGNPMRISSTIQLGYSPQATAELARQWTKAMWNSSLWKKVHWLGVPVQQWPTDLMLMQELIATVRPNCIVETGLYLGGTAVFYASILRLLGIDGRVISIEIQINPTARKNIEASSFADRIHLIEGDSKSEAVHERLRALLGCEQDILICLDSDHSYAHTLGELRAFSRYVPIGGYMVLFDTICQELAGTPNGQRSWTHDSPMTALEEFLAENRNFQTDPAWEKFMVTFAPRGFLRRVG
ncbi:MAG: class I SAM-dependent methyltransferase [Acidobacteria bacterium]|nr:class I SAM-dependent methyltransferase [Acidobacteriota bacterium]